MAYSAATYKGDGSQSTFIIPFDYLQKDFVKVTINEVDKVYAQDYNVDGRELSFPTAPPSGSIIKVYRETPTDRMVKWNEGSVLTSSNMTTQQIQELHLIEETTYNLEDSAMVKTEDNHKWEGKYLPITHVGDPIDDSDAVNLGMIKKEETGFLASVRSQLDKWLADLGTTYNSYSKSLKESFDSYVSSLKNQFDTHTSNLSTTFNDYKTTLLSKYNEYLASLTATKDAVKNSEANASKYKDEAKSSAASAKDSATQCADAVATCTTRVTEANQAKESASTSANTATTKANESGNSASLSKKWAVSAESPDGAVGSKSSKTWAEEAKASEQKATTSANNAKASENNSKASEVNAKASETASANSATASAKSATAAKGSEDKAKSSAASAKDSATQCADAVATCTTRVTEANQAKESASTSANTATTKANESGNSASLSKKWAVSAESPDGAVGSKSSKTWAEEAKASEQKATTSANNAKASENNSKASEVNAKASETASANSATASAKSATAAKGSEDKAKTSEVNAKASEVAAAESAEQAAAGQINADWNETNANSKAYIKNKPAVYPKAAKLESEAPVDTPTDLVYAKCGIADRFRIRVGGAEEAGWVELATGDDNAEPIYVRQYKWNTSDSQKDNYFGALVREAVLLDGDGNTSFPYTVTAQNFTGLASKATADAAGNNIQNTYAKKSDLSTSVSTTSLTVTGATSVPTANEGNSSNTIASTEFVAKSIAKLVDSSPESLNTLNELAKALGNDPNFSTTVINELGKKMNSVEAESTFAKKEEAGVLSGTVMAFSGTFEDGYPIDKKSGLADKKWHLCDGTNGTPDLRNRFIYGGTGNNNGDTGGEVTHKLTEAELPPAISNAYIYHGKEGGPIGWLNSGDGNHIEFSPVQINGGNLPHNNMPPYYVLAYIMKL